MNSVLWEQAEKLAARSYSITIEDDTLSNGQVIFLARHPELPGCKAQGNSRTEAEKNLADARVDYIYTLLEAGLEIPEPTELISSSENQSVYNAQTWTFDASTTEAPSNPHSSYVAHSHQTKDSSGIFLEGDLVKQD